VSLLVIHEAEASITTRVERQKENSGTTSSQDLNHSPFVAFVTARLNTPLERTEQNGPIVREGNTAAFVVFPFAEPHHIDVVALRFVTSEQLLFF